MSMKTISYLLCAAFVLFILSVIMPRFGKQKYDLAYRNKSLMVWVENVKAFEKETGGLPSSLYQVYLHIRTQVNDIAVPIVLERELATNETEKLKTTPDYFLKLIQYKIVISGNEWYVKEDRTDVDVRSRELAMDKEGSTRWIK